MNRFDLAFSIPLLMDGLAVVASLSLTFLCMLPDDPGSAAGRWALTLAFGFSEYLVFWSMLNCYSSYELFKTK